MYLNNNDKSLCSGCTACKTVCPKGAIEMFEDEEGFRYPKIDEAKCVDCKLCEKVCPNVKLSSKNNIIETYGVKLKNEEERKTSRSGGIFVAISDYILEENGVVYGVKMDNNFNVFHDRATNAEERFEFKGSKYVQSDMNNVIKKVAEDLENGKKVLFTGTACQVAGVYAAIPEKYHSNLLTCDLICYGVPSTRVYRDYLEFIEKTENKKIKKFNFRDKKYGWDSHYETITFEDGSEKSFQYFKKLFYTRNCLRPSCYKCNYANVHKPADITIADFWGIDEINPEFNDNKGVSLVIINNEKGKNVFENIKNNLDIINVPIETVVKYTYTLNQPTPIPDTRDEFWKEYAKNNFEYIINKYTS